MSATLSLEQMRDTEEDTSEDLFPRVVEFDAYMFGGADKRVIGTQSVGVCDLIQQEVLLVLLRPKAPPETSWIKWDQAHIGWLVNSAAKTSKAWLS